MLARNGKTPTEIGKILTDERTLVPSEVEGKLKLIPTSSILNKGQSFNSRRAEIQSLTPGCDMYYTLSNNYDMPKDIRDALKLSKTVVELDDKNLATIIDKRTVNLNIDLFAA